MVDMEGTVRDGARFRLAGHLARPGRVTVDDLRALPARTVRARFECECGPPRPRVFSGPLLYDVIMTAAPDLGPAGAADRSAYVVTVTGADGHQATLPWSQIAPESDGAGVLLATEADGRRLDEDGPRLAVPGDTGGGRCVSGVAEVWIGPAEP